MSVKIKNNTETEEFHNVKFLLTSSMRTLILVVLYNDSKNLNEIRDELQKPSATILHGLKELEAANLLKKDKKNYSLTSNGYLLATNIIKLINNWYSLERHKTFWNNHDISGIPEQYMNKLYLLKDAQLISSTTSDLSNAFNTYMQLLENSRDIKMILPIYSENHFKYLIKLLKEEHLKHMTILISSRIHKKMRRSRYLKKTLLKNKKVTIIEMEKNPKVFLTFSEDFMTLTLFFKDKHYDDSQMIIEKSENGLRWADGLFKYYEGE
ncbi:helix-turn-helix transcriptional regulator [Methanobrevibacter sp.]|uniref:helix-turn-helix transcriptional regulator n=1 Tax=Methanobrevibacter sp. TaxID=66852 RepID=UPI00388DC600